MSQLGLHMVSSVLSSCGQTVSSCLHSGDLGVGGHLLTIAAEITGSVGVRQADIVKQDVKSSEGKSSNMNPEETHAVGLHRDGGIHAPATINHPIAIVGTTSTSSPRACSIIYGPGNSTPISNRPTANTTLITSSVITPLSGAQPRGLNASAQ